MPPSIDISLPGYSHKVTPSSASKGGTMLYVSNKYDYKLRKDLMISDPGNYESTFIEIINQNSKNKIIGSVYKHHSISTEQLDSVVTGRFSCFPKVLKKGTSISFKI